jgi:voltage-gated potassium channel
MCSLARWSLGAAALLAVYFAVPVRLDRDFSIRAIVTVLGIGMATFFIVRQLRRPGSPMSRLAVAVGIGVLVFALADYVLAVAVPGEFAGLRTRVDALYFALSTLATVGFGDVHAEGQLARALISAQIVFNVVVLATAASILARWIRARLAPGRN